MADAKKCDRCGKYYAESEQKYTVDSFRVGCIKLVSVSGVCIDKYDLCDDCIKKLMIFLDNIEVIES